MDCLPYGQEAGPDTAAETDRRWFEAHPGRFAYVRLPVPGEWWPHGNGLPETLPPDTVEAVGVVQMAPGDRRRKAVVIPADAVGALGKAGDIWRVLNSPIGTFMVNDVDADLVERRRVRAAEVASDDDRCWFELHPGETVRHRPAFPDEFPRDPGLPPGEWEQQVEVTRLGPGLRVRRPLFAVWLGGGVAS